jgi:hypothetical protein
MTRFILAAGVAALAITAPAAAGPHGGGHGGGHGNGGGHAAAQKHGGGGGHGQKARQAQGGGGHARQAKARPSHGGGMRAAMRAQKPHGGGKHVRQAQAHQNRGQERHAMQAQRGHEKGHGKANVRTVQRVHGNHGNQARREMVRRNEALGRNNGPVLAVRGNERVRLNDREAQRLNYARNYGYGMGACPPGLAKKAVPCVPPGQAKAFVGQRLNAVREQVAFRELPDRLQYLYGGTPDYYYRYGDGYLYQVNRRNDVISSLLPLFGLGYTAGQVFPSSYPYYGMPAAYQPFYPSSSYYDYRYADGYMYQVNPYTGMIQDVDPLLGYGYGYGQMMPLAYSAYNVPYQYRPYYYDTGDYYYRYAPGAIYQVDPTTSLITAVAALLSPNSLGIGQPLPIGYSAYNVPYAYRSTYYDTPNDWYRYSNGSIYRVDPATQLVTALVVSALT